MTSAQQWPILATAALFSSAMAVGGYFYPIPNSYPLASEDIALFPTFFHNLRIIVFLSAGGLLLAVPTVLVAAWNAFMTGALFAYVAHQPVWLVSLSIHGLPELAGQFCGTVSGLKTAAILIRTLAHDDPFRLAGSFRWLCFAIVLTLLAAVLEWGVSPHVYEMMVR